MPTFTQIPSYSSGGKKEFKVNVVEFGDGYKQRVAANINNSVLEFDLRFTKQTQEVLAEIDAFLTSMAGVTAFEWNPPAPHDYASAPTYSGGSSYAFGVKVKDGLGNVFSALQANAPGTQLTDATRWAFLAKIPLKFTCSTFSWAYDEWKTYGISATFMQVFEP